MTDFKLEIPVAVLADNKDKVIVPLRCAVGWSLHVYDYDSYVMGNHNPRFIAKGQSYWEAELGAREFLTEFPDRKSLVLEEKKS